jgi:hypothetical protein
MRRTFWAFSAVGALVPMIALAQFFPPAANFGGFYAPSTAAESYQRGLAEVVRSAADANLMASLAAQNLEAARSQDIENRVKWTEAYYEMRRANKAYRASKRSPRLSQEQIARVTRAGMPKRLTSAQVDPLTGELAWPIVLRDRQYADQTEQLDKLFGARAATSMVPADGFQTAKTHTDVLLAALKKNIDQYKPADWIDAKKFVDSVAYEARFPAG